jgi:hypothetical protein
MHRQRDTLLGRIADQLDGDAVEATAVARGDDLAHPLRNRLAGSLEKEPMAKRSKFDIRYSGPIIAVATTFLIAWIWIRANLNKSEPAPEIITQQEMMCKSYETHERFVGMIVAKDFQAANKLFRQEGMLGNCAWSVIGTKIRIEQSGPLVSCIAPLGSTEPCMWTVNEAFKR